MSRVPDRPKIYHIVHVDRLPSILTDGCLWSDARMASRSGVGTTIGMTDIKARRLRLPIDCRPGLVVGQCVPFYFCPRSVMLYLLQQANHPRLGYRGGQGPIVHLEADLHRAVEWAAGQHRQWAFTLSNAGANYFESRCDLGQLAEVNWEAVGATRWSGPGIDEAIKEGKQAEFLVHESFPWGLVERIGVSSPAVRTTVSGMLSSASHQPPIEVRRDWYYPSGETRP